MVASIDKFLAKSEVKNERYDLYSCQLFDLIDKIERYGFLENFLTIPNVVAADDQTSGKSSVFGRLSGIALTTGDGTIQFVPRIFSRENQKKVDLSNVCTRREKY